MLLSFSAASASKLLRPLHDEPPQAAASNVLANVYEPTTRDLTGRNVWRERKYLFAFSEGGQKKGPGGETLSSN